MRLTAGLLTYNSEKFAKRCLQTLMKQNGLGELHIDWQIVVLDNASKDRGYVRELQDTFQKITMLFGEENVGFSKGHNRIICEFPADFHAVLNIDVLFSPDFLCKLLNALQENPRAGSATGKLLRWDPQGEQERTNVIDSAGMERTMCHAFYDLEQGEVDRGQYNTVRTCFGGTGAATLYRRSSLEKMASFPNTLEQEEAVKLQANSYNLQAEYFDERMFMYKEDVDIAYRLHNAGYPCLYIPSAVAWHARTTQKGRKERSQIERIYSSAHESLILKKQRDTWTIAVRICTAMRQWCRWSYLFLCEPKVFFASRKLLRDLQQ